MVRRRNPGAGARARAASRGRADGQAKATHLRTVPRSAPQGWTAATHSRNSRQLGSTGGRPTKQRAEAAPGRVRRGRSQRAASARNPTEPRLRTRPPFPSMPQTDGLHSRASPLTRDSMTECRARRSLPPLRLAVSGRFGSHASSTPAARSRCHRQPGSTESKAHQAASAVFRAERSLTHTSWHARRAAWQHAPCSRQDARGVLAHSHAAARGARRGDTRPGAARKRGRASMKEQMLTILMFALCRLAPS